MLNGQCIKPPAQRKESEKKRKVNYDLNSSKDKTEFDNVTTRVRRRKFFASSVIIFASLRRFNVVNTVKRVHNTRKANNVFHGQ